MKYCETLLLTFKQILCTLRKERKQTKKTTTGLSHFLSLDLELKIQPQFLALSVIAKCLIVFVVPEGGV